MKRTLQQLVTAGIFVRINDDPEEVDPEFRYYEIADGYQVNFKDIEDAVDDYTTMTGYDVDEHGNASIFGPCGLEHTYECVTHETKVKHEIEVYKVTELKSI